MMRRTLASFALAAAGIVYGAGACSDSPSSPPRLYLPADAGSDTRGLVFCGDAAVDLSVDDSNCGSCGTVCNPASECKEGVCRYPSSLSYGVCEFDDGCGVGEMCIRSLCTPVRDEECDGADDDRDGTIDNMLPRSCYTGSAATDRVGICSPGIEFCVDGAWSACTGQVLPVAEDGILLCDGRDDDCDGCPDNRYDETGRCLPAAQRRFDIAVIMDVSGSMWAMLPGMKEAIDSFGEAFDRNHSYRFALFRIPYADLSDYSTSLVVPFGPYGDFRDALRPLELTDDSPEPSYDVPYRIAAGAYPELGFLPDAERVIILVTDEPAQSYINPHSARVDEERLCEALTPDYTFGVVTGPWHFSSYDRCATVVENTYTTEMIASNLQSLLARACGE